VGHTFSLVGSLVELTTLLEHLKKTLCLLDAILIDIILGVIVSDCALHSFVHHQVIPLHPVRL
jgi:hypothetical protein